MAEQLSAQAKEQLVELVGPDGLINQLTNQLGYYKHDPAGRSSGNSRNREHECERSLGVSAVVRDQVDLNEARLSVIPVCPSTYRNLTSRQ